MKILFLDFDGVLHPFGTEDEWFIHLPFIASVIKDTPVVISSSWREVFSFDELCEACAGLNVVGITPSSKDGKAGKSLSRLFECIDWLKSNGQLHANWKALDDQRSLFEVDCPCSNLILCQQNIGCAPHSGAAEELKKWVDSTEIVE